MDSHLPGLRLVDVGCVGAGIREIEQAAPLVGVVSGYLPDRLVSFRECVYLILASGCRFRTSLDCDSRPAS